MKQLLINAEDEHVKYALELFFTNYKDAIVQFVNNVLKNEVGSSDAEVLKDEDGTITVYRTAPDKGWVLSDTPDGLAVAKYIDLETGTKYVLFDGDKLALFLKEPAEEPDLKIGVFSNLNHAHQDINSEDVKLATENAISRKEAGKKVEKDIERKDRIKALSKNQTSEQAVWVTQKSSMDYSKNMV